MRIIIHAGFHKTATTWFQRNYYPYVKNFEYFSEREGLRRALLNVDLFDFYPDEAYLKLSQLMSSNTIICEEDLIGGLRVNSIFTELIARKIQSVFPSAEIVFFIRNQLDRFLSTYLYYLKSNGGTYSPQDFILKRFELPNNRGDINLHHLEYHRTIEFYQDLFGKDMVKVFLYEDFNADNPNFLIRYAKTIGLDVDMSKVNFNRENVGLRKRLIPVARFLGHFYQKPIIHKDVSLRLPMAERLSKYLLNKLNNYDLFGEKPTPEELFGEKLCSQLSDFYRDSNRILFVKHNLTDLKRFNYPL